MKRLSEIIPGTSDVLITGITDDSRQVKAGYLFVATKGFNVDHYDFIIDAVKNGAVAVVSDRAISDLDVYVSIVDDANLIFPQLCQRFYDIDLNCFAFIGITGTDGKTTSATILREAMGGFLDVAYLGSNGLDVLDYHYDTSNTTPCIPELYKCLSIIQGLGCKTVVMEVSSEALLHHRIDGLRFDIIAFTNITEDHLNIHGNIDNYRETKFSLVNYLKDNGSVYINGDDENCRKLTCNNLLTFGMGSNNDFTFSNIVCGDYTTFMINYPDASIYKVISHLDGDYNVYNMGLAFIIALSLGINPDILLHNLSEIRLIRGRGEKLSFGQDFDIILDYAHTYNAIFNILEHVKSNNYERIIVVTGAAGGREKEKRVRIGEMLLEKADLVVFTMDDPRFEMVDDIIDDMLSSTTSGNYIRIYEREEAIYKALSLACKGDCVLILGKGRDNYMAIGDKKIPYCDYDVIKKYFEE